MRLTKTAFADHDYGASLIGSYSLDAFQQVVRGIGDLQKLLGCDLSRARALVVGKLNGCALKSLTTELFTQRESKLGLSSFCRRLRFFKATLVDNYGFSSPALVL